MTVRDVMNVTNMNMMLKEIRDHAFRQDDPAEPPLVKQTDL